MKKILCISLLLLPLIISGCTSIDSLIKENKLKDAKKFCKEQSGKDQKDCYSKLAHYYLSKKLPLTYKKYAKKAGTVKNEINKKIAYMYYNSGDCSKAIPYLKKIKESAKISTCYEKFAENNFKKQKYSLAALNYQKAGNRTKERESWEAAAQKAFSETRFTDAGKYFKKINNYSEAKKSWNLAAKEKVKEKDFLNAALYFSKAGNKKSIKKISGKLKKTAKKHVKKAKKHLKKSGKLTKRATKIALPSRGGNTSLARSLMRQSQDEKKKAFNEYKEAFKIYLVLKKKKKAKKILIKLKLLSAMLKVKF